MTPQRIELQQSSIMSTTSPKSDSFPKHESANYKMTDFYLALALTLIVVIITYFLSRRLKKSSNVVILTGLSESGKTAIFSKLVFNKPKKSVLSLKENEATLKEFNLRLVDLPGTERLRDSFWEQYRTKANHVIFVLDSSTVESKIRDLSEYLYTLLADGVVHRNKIKFTIACNKQDLEGATKKDSVKDLLEKELNAIRGTKTGQLAKTSNEQEEDYLAKLEPGEISFELLKVNLIETSIHNPEQLIKTIL